MATSRKKLAADAWGALLRVQATLVPLLDRELRSEVGLPLGWYDVLLELANAEDGRLTMTELAERAVLSRTRISRVVDELTDAGLVGRQRNDADGRSAYAVITERGRQRFREAAPHYLRGIEQRFAEVLTADELRTISDALGRVLDHQRRPSKR